MSPVNPHESAGTAAHPGLPVRAGVEGAGRPPALAPTPPPPALSAGPSAVGLLNCLRRRWPLALTASAIAAAVVFALIWYLPVVPGTGAVGLVRVASVAPRVLYGPEGGSDFERAVKTHASLAKSRSVLSEALRKPQVMELPVVVSKGEDAVSWLEKDIVVETTQGSELLRVTLKGDKPEQLAVVLSAVLQTHVSQAVERERKERLDKRATLEKQKQDQLARVDAIRARLAARLSAILGPVDPADPTGALKQKAATDALPSAEAELKHLRNDIKVLQSEVDARTGRDGTTPPELILSDALVEERVEARIKEDADLKECLANIEQLKQDIAYIQRIAVSPSAATREQRALTQLQQKVDARRKEVRVAVMKAMLDKAKSDLQVEVGKLERQLKIKKELETAAAQNVERLRREVQVARKLPEDVEQMQEQLALEVKQERRIDEELVAMRFRMDDPPRVSLAQDAAPAPRDTLRVAQMAGGAGVGMFGLVLFGIAFWEFRSRRVATLEDVAQGLGIRVLGAVPKLPPQVQRSLGTPASPKDVYWQNLLQESVDVTRTILLHAAQSERLQVVLVTSAVEGEGKTSLASQLAASLARAGRKTLLVDCDLRKPAAHKLFDVPQEPGVSELLRCEVSVADVVRPTRLSRLWLVPAGVWDPHTTQALAQEHVQTIFDEFRQEYDCVIVDSCPVLPVADALLIGQHVDAVLFSILRDESRLPRVYTAWQRMTMLGIRMLGAVVHGAKGDVYVAAYGNLKR